LFENSLPTVLPHHRQGRDGECGQSAAIKIRDHIDPLQVVVRHDAERHYRHAESDGALTAPRRVFHSGQEIVNIT